MPGSAQGDRAAAHGLLVVERVSVEAIDRYRGRLIEDGDDARIGRPFVSQQLQVQFQRGRFRPAPVDGGAEVPAILLDEIAKTLRRQLRAVQPVEHPAFALERTGRRESGTHMAIVARAQVQPARGGRGRLGGDGVDNPPRLNRAIEDGGRPLEHFHPFEIARLNGKPVVEPHSIAVVVAPGIQPEAANDEILGDGRIRTATVNAAHILQAVPQGGGLLIFEYLSLDRQNGLRCVFQRNGNPESRAAVGRGVARVRVGGDDRLGHGIHSCFLLGPGGTAQGAEDHGRGKGNGSNP